jgi:hypothetical protein
VNIALSISDEDDDNSAEFTGDFGEYDDELEEKGMDVFARIKDMEDPSSLIFYYFIHPKCPLLYTLHYPQMSRSSSRVNPSY